MAVLRRLPWNAGAWQALQALRARGVHAVLLHGARGTGKKGLALDCAEALLCAAPAPGGYACGRCAECTLLAAGSHPDLRVVVPDTWADMRAAAPAVEEEGAAAPDETTERTTRISREILSDQVRELAAFLLVSSHRGGARVVVLAPAESMNAAAANALLKLLEEPPAGAVFVLVSDAIDEVLPTIRSRCVLQRVELPARDAALAWLRERGVDDAERRLTATGGAPLLAAERGDGFDDASTPQLLLELLARGAGLGPAEVATRIPRAIETGPAIALFQRWAWDLLAHRSGAALRYHPRHATAVARIAQAADPDSLWQWHRDLVRAQASSEHPLNAKLVVESALLAYAAAVRPAAL
jgi:DNA polymerase-3 subunit delta'